MRSRRLEALCRGGIEIAAWIQMSSIRLPSRRWVRRFKEAELRSISNMRAALGKMNAGCNQLAERGLWCCPG
jgi:hypothetical protein